MADAALKCRRCHGGTDKIGEATDGSTATYKCVRVACAHVFVGPNIRKTYHGALSGPVTRDFSSAISQSKKLRAKLEEKHGRDNTNSVLANQRYETLRKWLEEQGIRPLPDLLAALKDG